MCVCVCVTVLPALRVGCINYLADVTWGFPHKHIPTQRKTEQLATFSSSLTVNPSPESPKGSGAKSVDLYLFHYFTSTEGRNNTTQRGADGRGGHREQRGGVRSVLHTHQHMQIPTDTQRGRTRRVQRGQRRTEGWECLCCRALWNRLEKEAAKDAGRAAHKFV